MSISSPATPSAALAEKRMYDAAGACGLVADPSRGIALSPRSARPADPRTGLVVSHQRMGHHPGRFRLWWRQLMGSDATLDNAHVAEDYLARTTTMYRIIAVGGSSWDRTPPWQRSCDRLSRQNHYHISDHRKWQDLFRTLNIYHQEDY